MENYPNITAGQGYRDPCKTYSRTNVYHIACPDCCGNPDNCTTCYGAGVVFNIDLDDVPDNTQVECPMCGRTVEANEISFNMCEECNRNRDEALDAQLEALLATIDTHKAKIDKCNENIKEIDKHINPDILYSALSIKSLNL